MQNLLIKLLVLGSVIGGSCFVVWQAHDGLMSASSKMDPNEFVELTSSSRKSRLDKPSEHVTEVESPLVLAEPTLEPQPTRAVAPSQEESELAEHPLMASAKPEQKQKLDDSEFPLFFSKEQKSTANKTPLPLDNAESAPQENSEPMPTLAMQPRDNSDAFSELPEQQVEKPEPEAMVAETLPESEPLPTLSKSLPPTQSEEPEVPSLRFGPAAAAKEDQPKHPEGLAADKSQALEMPGLTKLPPSHPGPVLLPIEPGEPAKSETGNRSMVINADAVESELPSIQPASDTQPQLSEEPKALPLAEKSSPVMPLDFPAGSPAPASKPAARELPPGDPFASDPFGLPPAKPAEAAPVKVEPTAVPTITPKALPAELPDAMPVAQPEAMPTMALPGKVEQAGGFEPQTPVASDPFGIQQTTGEKPAASTPPLPPTSEVLPDLLPEVNPTPKPTAMPTPALPEASPLSGPKPVEIPTPVPESVPTATPVPAVLPEPVALPTPAVVPTPAPEAMPVGKPAPSDNGEVLPFDDLLPATPPPAKPSATGATDLIPPPATMPAEAPTPVALPAQTPSATPAQIPAAPAQALPQILPDPTPAPANVPAATPSPNLLLGTAEHDAQVPRNQQSPELKIEKIAPKEAEVGEPVIYAIIIRNIGGSEARDVVVEDRIPKGAQLEGTIPQAYLNEGKLSWQLGTIEAGGERKIQLKVVPIEAGQIGSVATVSFASMVSTSIKVNAPKLTIDMKGPNETASGEPLNFQFTLRNLGQGVAKSVYLRAILPPGLKHPGGNDLEYECGTLAPGSERMIDLVMQAEHPGVFTIQAQVNNDGKTHGETRADVSVIKSRIELSRTGPENRFVGRTASCTLKISNTSSEMLQGITIQEKLPPGVELPGIPSGGRWDARTRTLTWKMDQLNAGESREINVLYLAKEPGDHVGKLVAMDEAGNQCVLETHMSVKGFAELTPDYQADQRTVLLNERVSFQLSLKNDGTAAGRNVRTSFILPDGVELVSARGPAEFHQQGNQVQFAAVAELPTGAEQVYYLAVLATQPGTQKITLKLESDDYSEPVFQDQAIRVIEANP